MDNVITSLNPQAVWKHFAAICAIPHTTGNENKLREYIIGIAKANKLGYRTDANGNLLVIKPATKGKENLKGVIFQAHLDMVAVKEDGKVFNFKKDSIDPIIDNGWVRCDGTTLGADSGVGVAAAIAILEATDIAHGPVEALFTVEEEAFFSGVSGLSKDFLDGDILINLGMDEEGELCLGCAGGVEMTASFKYTEDRNMYSERSAIRIEIRGLQGGHSGYDIDLQRANAIKLLFRFLYLGMKSFGLNINYIDAGGILSGIPREATAVVSGVRTSADDFLYGLEQFEKIIKEEYKGIEDGISIKGYQCELLDSVWDRKTMTNVILAVNGCPSGVLRMSPYMPDLVQTSVNLGRVVSGNGKIDVQLLLRSSSDTEREAFVNDISSIFELAGADVSLDNMYDGWMHDMNSEIYRVMDAAYEELFGKKPKAIAIHAGLECGVIGSKYHKLDVIACGPTIRGAHSPYEKVNIDSVVKFWELLKHTLANIPEK